MMWTGIKSLACPPYVEMVQRTWGHINDGSYYNPTILLNCESEICGMWATSLYPCTRTLYIQDVILIVVHNDNNFNGLLLWQIISQFVLTGHFLSSWSWLSIKLRANADIVLVSRDWPLVQFVRFTSGYRITSLKWSVSVSRLYPSSSLFRARSEVFTAPEIQVEVFWVVTSCSGVVGYQGFEEPCWIHLQGWSEWRFVLSVWLSLPLVLHACIYALFFQRHLLHSEDGGSKFLRNVILP